MDLGGAYVGRTQYNVLKLVEEFNLKLHSFDESDDTIINLRVMYRIIHSVDCKHGYYTPRNEVRGVYWNHPVRLSVRLSVDAHG